MMKLFNAQRKNLMNGKGIRKYLLYAIGEIILVVIGILIAVSINNANEVRKTKNHLKNVFVTYQEDLKLDTLKVYIMLCNYWIQERRCLTNF
ncbi:hypothetical protein GCM10009430_22840 [Aquimarina litoralis]|uniref:Uncharacterized protein n=1 Tax=Aquimarina litoralis TaxID=584605 RepID=A0ABP3U2A8_9FLAO